MRKFLAMLLAALMALSLVACGADESDIRGDIIPGNSEAATKATNATNATDATEATKGFSTGNTVSGKYVNAFAGLSCELGADWVYMTDDQIRQNNETAMGMVSEDYAEAIQNVNTFTDMMATHVNGTDTVSITFEKLTGANLVVGEEQYIDLSKDSVKGSLESMGMTNVELDTGKADFAGKEHPYLTIAAQYNGIPLYERMVAVKCQNYMVLVTACTWQTDSCKTILDTFKAA